MFISVLHGRIFASPPLSSSTAPIQRVHGICPVIYHRDRAARIASRLADFETNSTGFSFQGSAKFCDFPRYCFAESTQRSLPLTGRPGRRWRLNAKLHSLGKTLRRKREREIVCARFFGGPPKIRHTHAPRSEETCIEAARNTVPSR